MLALTEKTEPQCIFKGLQRTRIVSLFWGGTEGPENLSVPGYHSKNVRASGDVERFCSRDILYRFVRVLLADSRRDQIFLPD